MFEACCAQVSENAALSACHASVKSHLTGAEVYSLQLTFAYQAMSHMGITKHSAHRPAYLLSAVEHMQAEKRDGCHGFDTQNKQEIACVTLVSSAAVLDKLSVILCGPK